KRYDFKTSTDTYQMFTILAGDLLNELGCCGFIIPNSWMNRKGGEEFRKKLSRFNFQYVIDFTNQVFEDANIDTCIIIYSKGNDDGIVLAANVLNPESIISGLSYNEIKFANWVNYDKFNCSLSNLTFELFEKIKKDTVK